MENVQLIEKVFSALLSFSASLAAKYMSLKNKLCITRPTLIERTYYSFIIGTDKIIHKIFNKEVNIKNRVYMF